MSDRFEQLLKTLNQSELEMTSYELADLCWLLLHSPQIVEPAESKKEVEDISSNRNGSSSSSESELGASQQQDGEKEKKKEPAGQLFPRQKSKDSFVGGGGSLTFSVDNPSDLGSSLSLARALKALLRRVPTGDRPSILDEVRTVESFAATDQKILAPVFKPALEPWLELALVVDRSSSMDIWHQTLADLKTVLQHYGIFRDVQVWQLALKENNLVLYKGLNKTNSRVSHPKELLNPNGRRIILVVSDCVASYWQDGKVFPLLELWSQSSPVAILQMLPEWLWLKTGLGLGAKVTLVSDEPGLTNSRLRIRDVLLWENVFHDKKRLQIPIFTLDPFSVERWSGVVVGRSDTKVAGFVLTPDTKEELDTAAEPNLTPEEIVRRFRNNASPLAQELAELLAAAPTIFLPVVRLIRKEMLPEAGQVQIAEVFLGAILRVWSSEIKETDPDLVLYDFIDPEVRKILQCSSTRSTTVDVFDRVSKYIAKRLNLELRDFLAELKKPPTEVGEDIQGIIRPFAEVSARILRNLGGNYLAIAQQLEQAVVEAPQFSPSDPSQVRLLQEALLREGIKIDVDGIWGANTQTALRTFQQQRGLVADGILGSQVLQELGLRVRDGKLEPVSVIPDGTGKHYAIAIGINHYINLDSNQYAVKDAQDIHNFLSREAGFEQVRLFTDNSFPLAREPGNPESSQLTPELLARFLDETLKTLPISVEDNLWFFFSGHGIRLENIDYLVLSGNISERVEDTAISVSFIVEQLQRYGTGNVILFLDADRDRAVYSSNLRIIHNPQQELGITSIAPPQSIATAAPDRGTIVFYSSSPGEGACEIESLQQGAFTYALLEALQQRKVGEAITVESLAQELRDRLPALIQQYSKPRQTPEVKAEPDSKNRLPLLPSTPELETILSVEDKQKVIELLPYESAEDLDSVLDLISKRHLKGTDTPEEDVAKLFNKPKGDDGTYYLLENLCLLGCLEVTKTGGGAGTVRYDLAPQYLQSRLPQPLSPPQGEEFASRKEQLRDAQKRLLDSIVERSKQQQDTTQADTEHLFDRPKVDLARYRRLEHLRLLGFIRKTDAGTGIGTSKYNLTPEYWEYLRQPRSLSFTFETVTVNRRGKIIKTETKQAYYFRENLTVRLGNTTFFGNDTYLGNDVDLDLVAIPGGTFLMGTEDEEIERLCKKYNGKWFRREKPQHKVTVQSFFMGKYPVTQAQWRAIASRSDLKVERDLNNPDPSHFKGDNRPVEQVSWYDAIEFCGRLSKLTGRDYRLPSEAEWEYACRAIYPPLAPPSEGGEPKAPLAKGGWGGYPPFYFGETITGELANYNTTYPYADEPKGEYRRQTTPVGQFPPNAFGLYDMHGNVWEWCADHWHESYADKPENLKQNGNIAWVDGNITNQSLCMLRGGSWNYNPRNCRSAYRNWLNPDNRDFNLGLRVVASSRT